MKIPNSRQRILNYILEQGSATVEELAKVFRVSQANIRHHLSVLTEQGSVKVIGQKTPAFKGRPALIYCSKQQSEKNNLHNLSDALLCSLFCDSENNKSIELIEDIARQISSRYKIDHTNQTRRLYSTIQSLNHMNYQAHWEAHFQYPRIMFGHCPYQDIIDTHPELCQMDLSLLEILLGSPVRQIEKRDMTAKGIRECVFFVSETGNPYTFFTKYNI